MGVAREKLIEVLTSIIPIVIVVSVLAIAVLQLPIGEALMFVLCVAIVIIGFTLFLMGVEYGIHPIGKAIGLEIPKRKSRIFMILVVFLISFLVTIAEPDVTVFGTQVHSLFPNINPDTLMYAIAIGVAAFLIVAAFRIIYRKSLRVILTLSYIAVIAVAVWLYLSGNPEFLGIGFDSGGVTTGPVTVPILLALGIGICSVGMKKGEMEGFGMIGLASVGPILAVLILGLVSGSGEASSMISSSVERMPIDTDLLIDKFIESATGVLEALLPLVIFFILFQKVFLRYSWTSVIRMVEGTAMAGIGIILFLTGVYTGFMPIAIALGDYLGDIAHDQWYVVIGLGLLLGFLVSFAEPAVSILGDQVEASSEGLLPRKMIVLTISIGVAALVALGMAKLIFNINFLYIIVPGYVITLILMWLGDKEMVGIAFDAGGVSTGPMSVAILSSIYIGLASSMYTGTEAVIYGFGLIALIALAPCMFLSGMGIYIKAKKRKGAYA